MKKQILLYRNVINLENLNSPAAEYSAFIN
jgi:hypothetical protein